MWKYIDDNQLREFLLSLCLIDEKDEQKYLKTIYSISNNIENNYIKYKIGKRNGEYRNIYEPKPILKHIQRQILHNILENKKISKYATAYHKNISLLDNAKPHLNKKIILKLDIKNFFDSINFIDIYKTCFPIEYFPKPIGILLTYLCTYKDYLPQGAPTSAYISNLVMKEFDEEVGYWCEKQNISYTRYSDDMTFSGDFNPSQVIKYVRKMLLRLNLELNEEKIHVVSSSQSQQVTGIVVNKKTQVRKKYRKRIRQEMYYLKKHGLDNYVQFNNIANQDLYLRSIQGRINFVLQINKEDKEFIQYKKSIDILVKNNYNITK